MHAEEEVKQQEKITQDVEKKSRDRRVLYSKVARCFPLINESNLIASDLGRHVKFTPKLLNVLPDDVTSENDLDPENWEKILKIEVANSDYGLIWLWDVEKFEDRLSMMKEMLEEYQRMTHVTPVPPEDDPYWDPPEEHLIGKAYYSLKALGLLFDNPFDLHIISTQGGDAGTLKMNINPIEIDEEDCPEAPEEVVGTKISFDVEISEATNLPSSHANNVYCTYDFWKEETRITSTVPMHNENP